MSHPQREIAVVGEDEKAFRVIVQAPDREQPLADLLADQVEHRGATLRVLGGGHDAIRLVEQDVPQGLGGLQALPIDLDRVDLQIRLVTQLGAPPVHPHAALANEAFRLPARSHASPRDQFLEPLKAH